MIFVTVGGQLPFDRLVETVDAWAGRTGRTDVFVQTGGGNYVPRHVEARAFLSPAEFRRRAEGAGVIVAHAGMGTILTALSHGRPLVVMPRRHALGEQRNDHQLATARRFRDRPGVTVAMDEEELARILDGIDELAGAPSLPPHASPELLAALGGFLDGVRRARGRT